MRINHWKYWNRKLRNVANEWKLKKLVFISRNEVYKFDLLDKLNYYKLQYYMFVHQNYYFPDKILVCYSRGRKFKNDKFFKMK